MLNLEPLALEWGAKLLGALLILLLGRWVALVIRNIVQKVIHQGHMNESLGLSIGKLTYYVLLMFAVLAAIAHLGVETTAVVAVIATVGLAIGLALQGSLANFASGVLLLFLRPFKVGDFVNIADVTGKVDDIAIFTTTLDKPDNTRVIIPNARVTGHTITNFSTNDIRRIDLSVHLAYGDDLDRARAVLLDVMNQDDRILRRPASEVVVTALGETNVSLEARPWVKNSAYWAVSSDLLERIKKRFDAEGFSVPVARHESRPYKNN